MSFFEKNVRPEIRFKLKKGEEFESLHLFPLFSRAIVTFSALRHGRFSLFPIEHSRPPADALKDRDDRLSLFGQRILDPWRDLVVGLPTNDVIGNQFLECGG